MTTQPQVTNDLFIETGSLTFCSSNSEDYNCKHKRSSYADSGWLEHFLQEANSCDALFYWIKNSGISCKSLNKSLLQILLAEEIARIDSLMSRQLNVLLHHCDFQKLEASWRGVLYLAEQAERYDNEGLSKIKILPLSWRELSRDLTRAIDFDQSELFKLIYGNEFDMPGGEPFGVLVGDYQISSQNRSEATVNDIDLLKDIAQIAAASFAPFLTTPHPSMFGVNHFSELGSITDLTSHFQQEEYHQWRTLRSMDDARFIGLIVPFVLMRPLYDDDGRHSLDFNFTESRSEIQSDYLWGSACYSFVAVLIRAFAESGWFGQIRGIKSGKYNHGLVTDLAACQEVTTAYRKNNLPSVDLLVGEKFEMELSENGFIPLSAIPYTDHCAFFSNSSVHKPPLFSSRLTAENARLATMLQYLLCVSRFAHYIKIMGRDKIGSFQSPSDCEQELQHWLHSYTTASDSASEEVRARCPLNAASIKIQEIRGQPGRYSSVIQLKPHFQLNQMVTSIRLVTDLTPKNQPIL